MTLIRYKDDADGHIHYRTVTFYHLSVTTASVAEKGAPTRMSLRQVRLDQGSHNVSLETLVIELGCFSMNFRVWRTSV